MGHKTVKTEAVLVILATLVVLLSFGVSVNYSERHKGDGGYRILLIEPLLCTRLLFHSSQEPRAGADLVAVLEHGFNLPLAER